MPRLRCIGCQKETSDPANEDWWAYIDGIGWCHQCKPGKGTLTSEYTAFEETYYPAVEVPDGSTVNTR
jgi:hypothetical protein